jgi:hypothetical protein
MSIRFTGFEDEMFESFSRFHKDPSDITWIKGRMELFGKKLLHTGLQALDSSLYRECHVGVFHPDDDETLWVAFGLAELDDLLNCAHQTVSLSGSGLEVYVRVGSVAAIDLLRRNVRSREKTFIQIVTAMPEPFEVQVRERTRRAPKRFVVGPPVLGLAPAEVRDPASSGFSELVRLLAEIRYPHFSIRRRLDRNQVIELGGSCLVDEVLNIMTAFQPLVTFLNEDPVEIQRLEAQIRALQAQIDALGGGTGTP